MRSLPGRFPTPSFHSMALTGSKSLLPSVAESFLSVTLSGEDALSSASVLLRMVGCFIAPSVTKVDVTTLPPGGAEDTPTVDLLDVASASLPAVPAGRTGCIDAIHNVASVRDVATVADVLVSIPPEGALPRGMLVTMGTNWAGTCARSFAPGGSTVPGVMKGARIVVPADCTRAIWLLNRAAGGAGRIIMVVPLTNVEEMGSCPDNDVVALGAARQRFGGNFILDGIVEIRVGMPRFAASTGSNFFNISAHKMLTCMERKIYIDQ